MAGAKTTPDAYFDNIETWAEEMRFLRAIMLSTGLAEETKWGQPTYTRNGAHIAGLAAFKSYFGVWFPQGALLTDPDGVLINAQTGKTRAARQWRMTAKSDIRKTALKAYVKEAIALADAGAAIRPERDKPLALPPELKDALAGDAAAKAAFAAMRKGLRREYADYVAEAKRADTKARRIEKILPMIASGIGLNDRYRRSG